MKRVNFIANRDPIINYTLAPVRHNRRQLRDRGFDLQIHTKLSDACLDCDILCLISKPTYKHVAETNAVFQDGGPIIELLKKARARAGTIIWMDDSDSSSVTHFELMPYIDLYLKKQILRDPNLYREPFYGGRIFTNFYHRQFGVEDEIPFAQFHPLQSEDEAKLHVSWNIGLGDMFSAFALKQFAQRFAPDLVPVDYDVDFVDPRTKRPIDIFLRTSANLSRKTIAFHRQEMLRRLDGYFSSHKNRTGMVGNNIYQTEDGAARASALPETGGHLPIKTYRDVLSETKILPSPFGWGELGVRDYEAFIFGGMLLKPDMSHMETWPDIFIPNQTYVPLKWGFEDLDEVLDAAIMDDKKTIHIAQAGQDAYRNSISVAGMERFCDRFIQQMGGIKND